MSPNCLKKCHQVVVCCSVPPFICQRTPSSHKTGRVVLQHAPQAKSLVIKKVIKKGFIYIYNIQHAGTVPARQLRPVEWWGKPEYTEKNQCKLIHNRQVVYKSVAEIRARMIPLSSNTIHIAIHAMRYDTDHDISTPIQQHLEALFQLTKSLHFFLFHLLIIQEDRYFCHFFWKIDH